MERAAASATVPNAVAFSDGLGDRRHLSDPTGTETLELLCLRPQLATVPAFEFALRERVSRLSSFRQASFARVRSVERLTDAAASLAVVSERVPGVRLSEVLQQAEARQIPLDINTALCLLRQLVPAIAALHESARDVAHGALGPERLVLTQKARLVVVEYVMGAALEQLRFSQERYWKELRIALPRTVGLPRFDHRADITQVGIIALSLILGRPLREDEYPSRIADVVASTWAVSARGGFEPLPPGLRGWLGRALQIDTRNAFASAVEARVELDKVLGDSEYLGSPAAVEAFLARYHGNEDGEPAAPNPAVPPRMSAPAIVAREAAREQPPAPAEPVPARPQPAPTVAAVEPSRALEAKRDPLPRYETQTEPADFTLDEPPDTPSRWPKLAAAAALLAALVAGGGYAARTSFFAGPAAPTTGTIELTSNPPGATALIDGQARGVTPLTLSLAPGQYTIELRGGGGETRSVPVSVTAGAQASHYVELPNRPSALGQLQVRTEPAGAKVTVDGVPVGVSPMMVVDLAPGEHTVLLESELGSVKQSVTVEAGMTASLVVPMTAPGGAPLSGWVSVTSPIEVQLYEGGQLLGSSKSDRILMTAGRHELEIVNEALGYRATRVVQVPAGKVTPLALEAPQGVIALNAIPWADVWINGERVGQTPIGNLSLRIGQHDVVFRHPELGEQNHTALVTLKGVTRLSVDLRKR